MVIVNIVVFKIVVKVIIVIDSINNLMGLISYTKSIKAINLNIITIKVSNNYRIIKVKDICFINIIMNKVMLDYFLKNIT